LSQIKQQLADISSKLSDIEQKTSTA